MNDAKVFTIWRPFVNGSEIFPATWLGVLAHTKAMTPKQQRCERREAKAQFALRAIRLMATGATIESLARDFQVRPSDLTRWIGRFRERGFSGFHSRRLPPRSPLRTPAAIKEALRREKIVIEAFRIMAGGESWNWASYKLNVPGCQLYRWRKAYEADGFAGLLPRGVGFGSKHGHRPVT